MDINFDYCCKLLIDGEHVIFSHNNMIESSYFIIERISGTTQLGIINFYVDKSNKKLVDRIIVNIKQIKELFEDKTKEEKDFEYFCKMHSIELPPKALTINSEYTKDETNFICERYVVKETQSATNEEI